MTYHENLTVFVGNLTDDPELRFTPSGVAVANFTLASNRRWKDSSGQQQEEATFMRVNVWQDQAENVAESLHKGERVVVIGRLQVRSYEDSNGVTKWVTEIVADEVAPSLRWARAEVFRVEASNAGRGGGVYTPPPPSDDDVPF